MALISPSITAARASTAARAPSPSARSVTVSPPRTPSAITATGLRALARRSPNSTSMRTVVCLAALASRAAGRACRPWPWVTATWRSASPSPPASAAPMAVIGVSSISGSPTRTDWPWVRPVMKKASPLVRMIGVIRLFARRAMMSMSKLISRSPAVTAWPLATWTSKPSPLRPTVSSPMWIRISAPPSVRRLMAWPVWCTLSTTALQGEQSTLPVGSMARPSPSMRWANTGSGVSSSGAAQPSSGENKVMVWVMGLWVTGWRPVGRARTRTIRTAPSRSPRSDRRPGR